MNARTPLDEWGDEGLPEVSSYVSVVSRWDLAVVDSEALLSAGREAHRQERPSDTEARGSSSFIA